jgi:DNA-binding response OmpR family regulator
LETSANSSKNLLFVVDDEPELADMLTKGLSHYGFQVDVFGNREVALLRFKPNYYDMSILDIRMPVMNGFQLYRKAQRNRPKASSLFFDSFCGLS